MSSVEDILGESAHVERALQEGDKYTVQATERAEKLASIAAQVGELLHQASMLMIEPCGDREIIGHVGAGAEAYGVAAGAVMGMALQSDNHDITTAAEHASKVLAAYKSDDDGGRAIVLAAAVLEASNKICDAEIAITRVVGLAGALGADLGTAAQESGVAQESLQSYARHLG